MRRLRVQCPGCGGVDVSSDEVCVGRHTPGQMSFSFHCPHCSEVVAKSCDPQVSRLLLLRGARADQATVSELDAFCTDDVIRLRTLLDEPDWFDRFLDATGQ